MSKATGQGSAIVGKEVRKAKVDFDARKFDKFRKNHAQRLNQVRKQLHQRPHDEWIEKEYLEICRDEGISEVMRFIGVDPEAAPITVKTVKRNTSHIAERFTRPDEVMAHLEAIGRPDWAYEN
jgi:hypothetical protein